MQQAAALDKVGTVIVQDILPSAASQRATFVLAGGSFAERDGTFVNHTGLAQEIHQGDSFAGRSEARRADLLGFGRAPRLVEHRSSSPRDGGEDRVAAWA